MAQLPKQINTNKVVWHLKSIFEKATEPLARDNRKGTKLYEYQVDFCYFIDEIERGPKYNLSKIISECNFFINRIVDETSNHTIK